MCRSYVIATSMYPTLNCAMLTFVHMHVWVFVHRAFCVVWASLPDEVPLDSFEIAYVLDFCGWAGNGVYTAAYVWSSLSFLVGQVSIGNAQT